MNYQDKKGAKNISYLRSSILGSSSKIAEDVSTKDLLVTKMQSLNLLQKFEKSEEVSAPIETSEDTAQGYRRYLFNPKAIRAFKKEASVDSQFESTIDDEDKSESQRELDERNDALDELSSILAGSSSCPTIIPSGEYLSLR